MKNIGLSWLLLSLIVGPADLSGQPDAQARLPSLVGATMVSATRDGQRVFDIQCTFRRELTDQERKLARDSVEWSVTGPRRRYAVTKVEMNLVDKDRVWLVGDWDTSDELAVVLEQRTALSVETSDIAGGTTRWGFGKGKALDLSFRRLTTQRSAYAFDVGFGAHLVELKLSAGGGDVWFRSLTAEVTADGTLSSDEEVRNGFASGVGLSLNPYYFVAGLVYRSEASISYQLETRVDDAEDDLFDTINRTARFGIEVELPLTNYPIYKLHSKSGYARLAMPLTLSLDYLPSGQDGDGSETLARLDFKARYELAFSPYLILQGEWNASKFYDAPAGQPDDATYYSFSIAQDLDVLRKHLGFLGPILGESDELRGKHFIFFKVANGKQAPAFQDVRERSLGFGSAF